MRTQKIRYQYSLFTFLLILFALGFGLCSCSRMPAPAPAEPAKVPEPSEPLDSTEKEPEQKKISLTEILRSEARKFISQHHFQDALLVYNQALSLADKGRETALFEEIERVLSKMPPADIHAFSEIKNIRIPRSILLYWYGLNAALDRQYPESKQALETFLFEFADHPYAADAADLLKTIKQSLFRKDTIGCLLPLSGKYAVFGERALTGIQLAIRDLSAKYNKAFHLIVKDTEAVPEKAVEGVRLLHEQNVAAIIGPLLTVSRAGQEAQRLKIPMIGLTQKADFAIQGDYLFSNFITPRMQVRTLGAYLFRELGIKRVAVLYPDEKYGKTYMGLFWDVVEEYGAEIVGVEAYNGQKTDFTEPIQKLTGQFYPLPDEIKETLRQEEELFETVDVLHAENSAGSRITEPGTEKREAEEQEKVEIDFEALFIPDSPSNVNLILPQLAYNDATGIYLVGTNLWHHQSLLKDARGYNKRAVITDGFFADSRNPLTSAFSEKYESLFGTPPKFLEAISYDCANILFVTAMDETIDSRSALKNALKTDRIFEGVTGHTVFDQDGQAHRQLFLITIKKGKFAEVSQ